MDGSSNDGTVITVGGTLINLDTQDENTVIFIDNGENDVVINVESTGVLEGVNGVIFAEGDAVTITNDGTITGTGVATEGVVYIDRDADGELNTITNNGTITSVGGPAIGLDSLLGTSPNSSTTAAATAADPNVFGGTLNLALTNTGTIENTGTAGGTNAIFFNGDPGSTSEGSTSSSQRGCFENIAGSATPGINCQFGIAIDNSGIISSTNGEAIRNEDEAVLTGTLLNSGTISGGTDGILIAGAQAEHDLALTNSGTIEGADGAGLLITGDGVDLVNAAGGMIIGSDAGLIVTGSTADVRVVDRNDANTATVGPDRNEDFVVAAVNNTFTNAGTISGTRASVDLSGAGQAITFNQQNGALLGDFLGTTGFTDILNITGSNFTLGSNILQSVNTNVGTGVTLNVDGARTIDGNLVSDGILDFLLGTDSLAVAGDVTLNSGSVVNVNDTNGAVTALGQEFTLITSGGTLTNNAALTTTAVDSSFLLDFVVVSSDPNSVVVVAQAAASPPCLLYTSPSPRDRG